MSPSEAYRINRENFPLDVLEPLRGKFVAFNGDASSILCWAESELELGRKVRELGLSVTQFRVEQLLDPEDSLSL